MADTQKQAEAAAKAVIDAVEGFSGNMGTEKMFVKVILATVDNDRQIAQDEINEIYHHIDVMMLYEG